MHDRRAAVAAADACAQLEELQFGGAGFKPSGAWLEKQVVGQSATVQGRPSQPSIVGYALERIWYIRQSRLNSGLGWNFQLYSCGWPRLKADNHSWHANPPLSPIQSQLLATRPIGTAPGTPFSSFGNGSNVHANGFNNALFSSASEGMGVFHEP